MTDEQRAELKRLAEKATNGPWEPTQCGGFGVIAGPTIENSKGYIKGGRGQICEMDDMDASPAKQRANARFIAAANPTAVLDLLAENERFRSKVESIRDAAGSYFELYGAEHEDGCPEDDTCECPLVCALNEALR